MNNNNWENNSGWSYYKIMAILLVILMLRVRQGWTKKARQSETRARQNKQCSQVGPLNINTNTRTMANSQLGPFAIPTHFLGFCEFVAMYLLLVFFLFVYKYNFLGIIILRFEADWRGFFKLGVFEIEV
jgi:hypothetical protein